MISEKGSYIGQHKIRGKCPFNDGYRGSGRDWKKYILDKHITVEKIILRMCENVEDANYWEDYYIESAKAQGIYLWNRRKGGGNHQYDRLYTEEELREHHKKSVKQYYEANKEQKKQYDKKYHKQYDNQLCQYNGEILTLNALKLRFRKAGIEHPILEAKKYLIEQEVA